MNFFENPVIEIEDALSKLVTFGHPDQVRGQAYLITGKTFSKILKILKK